MAMNVDLWRPMDAAPRDGREIIARLPRFEIFDRVAWDGRRWASGATPIRPEPVGWMPIPEGSLPAPGWVAAAGTEG
jgi:hypothetical protein